jgi:hypothetical protein
MDPINVLYNNRIDAKNAGHKHYFTGLPCSRGHTSKRHLTGTCVDCQQIANAAWAQRNPGEGLKRSRAWQKRHPERARANSLRSWRKNAGIPEATRPCPQHCECCGTPLVKGKVHLDHDHVTGKFRGWLCNSCNLGIGALGDSIDGVKKALAYLRRA